MHSNHSVNKVKVFYFCASVFWVLNDIYIRNLHGSFEAQRGGQTNTETLFICFNLLHVFALNRSKSSIFHGTP